MRKNRGTTQKNETSYLPFFAPAGGAGFSVKTKTSTAAAPASRTALLNIVKKLDNSGA